MQARGAEHALWCVLINLALDERAESQRREASTTFAQTGLVLTLVAIVAGARAHGDVNNHGARRRVEEDYALSSLRFRGPLVLPLAARAVVLSYRKCTLPILAGPVPWASDHLHQTDCGLAQHMLGRRLGRASERRWLLALGPQRKRRAGRKHLRAARGRTPLVMADSRGRGQHAVHGRINALLRHNAERLRQAYAV